MIEQTEREYVSDAEAYEVFVGQITPQEFVKGYEEFESPVNEAVKDFLRNFPYDESIPEWLEDALYRYVESKLESIHHKIMEPIILKGSDYSYSVKFTGCSTTFYSISVANIEIGTIWQDEEDLSWTANLVNDPEQKNLVQGFAHELYAANYLEGHAARVGLLNGTDRVFTMAI